MTAPAPHAPGADAPDRPFPPVAQLAVGSMALVIVAGIYIASHLPTRPPLGPAVGLLIAAGVLLVADAVIVSRLQDFAWKVFFRVARWTLLSYGVISGLLEYVFVYDHTRGTSLVVLTLSLVVFALDIPLLLAFSVARFQDPGLDS